MHTIDETRRLRLELLIDKHGSIASLNIALGWARTDSRLTRIRNANTRTDREGKVFQMGTPMAREIEETLGIERGWMDTPPPPGISTDDPYRTIEKATALLAAMTPEARLTALRLLDALEKPANGTTGGH